MLLILDSNGYFNAKSTVTLEEASKMLERVVGKGYFEENKTTIYARNVNGGYKDGNAREAMFNRPMVLVLKGDVLYVADCGNQRIRKIDK